MDIWIWGTGCVAEKLFGNGLNCNVKGFVETKRTKETFLGFPVIEAENIVQDYDYIIVANHFSDEIHNWCVSTGLDMKKIFFYTKGRYISYVKPSKELIDILGERNFTAYQAQFGVFTDTFIEKDKALYQKMNRRENFTIREEYMWPVIEDKYAENGVMGNYFWQDLWAARKIIQSGIRRHYDIGSRVDGFIAHLLAAGIQVNVIDIRPFPAEVENLYTIVDDATMMNQFKENSIESMSALCSIEHFGLGRYGDPVDPEACFKCFDQIQRRMKEGGNLYLSLPIGEERLEFNAHRVFYAETVQKCFSKMHLIEFSCTAEGKIEYNVNIHKYDTDRNHGDFRYGLFHFIKK